MSHILCLAFLLTCATILSTASPKRSFSYKRYENLIENQPDDVIVEMFKILSNSDEGNSAGHSAGKLVEPVEDTPYLDYFENNNHYDDYDIDHSYTLDNDISDNDDDFEFISSMPDVTDSIPKTTTTVVTATITQTSDIENHHINEIRPVPIVFPVRKRGKKLNSYGYQAQDKNQLGQLGKDLTIDYDRTAVTGGHKNKESSKRDEWMFDFWV